MFNLKLLSLIGMATLSLTATGAYAGGGPHEHPTCKPGNVVVTPPHTAYETLVQTFLGENNNGTNSILDVYAQFEGRQTSKAGPGCKLQIVKPGTPSLHIRYREVTTRYDIVTDLDFTTDAANGISVQPIWSASGRVVGARYINNAALESLTITCDTQAPGAGSGPNIPGIANGMINGVRFVDAPINCTQVAWVTTLPR